MSMNHEELAKRLEKRLDIIEDKLDTYLSVVSTNKTDLLWVKGYIKMSLTALVGVGMAVLSLILKIFTK